MKKIILIVILILLAGISVVYASNYPQLTGTWVGTTYGHGYFPIKGTTEYQKFLDGRESMKVHYIIQEQKERLFWGIKKVFTDTGEIMFEEEFSGAFERDSQRFYIIEHLDGKGMGQVINGNEIDIVYLEGNDLPKVMIYQLVLKDDES